MTSLTPSPTPEPTIEVMVEAWNHWLRTGSASARDVALELADANRDRANDRKERTK